MAKFTLTQAQKKARVLLNGAAKIILLFGGSRSGKTFVLIRNIVLRALKEPNSRHAIFRQTRKDLKESIWMDTFPKVLALCFPGITPKQNENELYVKFHNGAEIWFGYLDDRNRTDNVLGKEYNTIYFNEISEISYQMFNKALTRLALKNGLVNKIYCDCNPPGRWHWAYKLWIKKIIPGTKDEPVRAPEKYDYMLLNPKDNVANLPPDYLELLEGLPEEEKNRFLLGLWQEGITGGIYTKEIALAEQEGRIGKVPYNHEYAVYTFWDLGVDDHTAIVFAQFVKDRINIIDYYENSNEGMEYYVNVLREKRELYGYSYPKLYIPHDGANREWITGRNRRQALEGKGFEVEVLPADAVADGINGVKALFPQCRFDEEKCAGLLDALRNYKRKFDANKLTSSPQPEHNWASHGSDAFRYMAMGYNKDLAKPKEINREKPKGLTINDLIAQRKRKKNYGIGY